MVIQEEHEQPATKTTGLVLKGRNLFFLVSAIVLVTGFSFLPALKNSFTNWDDNGYVFENPHLSKPLPESIKYFFGQNYFIGNYIPVTMIVYAMEYHVAKLDPGFFHLVQLIIHVLNVLLVFWLIYLLSGKKPLVAAFVALFFGIHPMHVESVAWVAELKDVLYTFFFIMGLITYYIYLERLKVPINDQGKTKTTLPLLIATLLLFILSVLSKPAALIFPLVLFLFDFHHHRVFNLRTWLEKIPFFIISFVLGYVAILAQQADNLLHTDHSWAQRFLFASHSFMAYMVKLFLPIRLSNFYPYPDAAEWLPISYYLAPFAVLFLIVATYRTLKYSRLYVFGFLFFIINILLVLQFVSIGDAIMAERYTYVSYIGLLYILGMLLERFYQSIRQKKVLLSVLLILVAATSYFSRERTRIWKNDDTLATDLLDKYPNDWLALNNKGFILSGQGYYEKAIPLYKRALAIKPDYTRASINLINSCLTLNYNQTALKFANEALMHTPADANLLNAKAHILTGMGNNAEAAKVYKQALKLPKKNPDVYINLAICLFNLNDYTQALKILDEGLVLYPSSYILLNNKGYTLFIIKKYSEAIPYFKKSLALKPDYSTAKINLEDCYKAMNSNLNINEKN